MWCSQCSSIVNRALKIISKRNAIPIIQKQPHWSRNILQLRRKVYNTQIRSVSSQHVEANSDSSKSTKIVEGPGLEYFIANSGHKKLGIKERLKARKTSNDDHPYLTESSLRGDGKHGKYIS